MENFKFFKLNLVLECAEKAVRVLKSFRANPASEFITGGTHSSVVAPQEPTDRMGLFTPNPPFNLLQDISVWSKSLALDATHCGLALCLPHSHSVTLPAVVL